VNREQRQAALSRALEDADRRMLNQLAEERGIAPEQMEADLAAVQAWCARLRALGLSQDQVFELAAATLGTTTAAMTARAAPTVRRFRLDP
jgi:hypothetical protein